MFNRTRVLSFVIALILTGVVQLPAMAQFVRDLEATAAVEAGIQLLKQEDWNEAVESFSKAVEIDPTFPEAYVGIGDALRELEDYQGAINNYRQALDINPKLSRALYGRGVCWREQGDLNAAITDFDDANQLDRKDPEIAADLGDLLVTALGDPIRGKRLLDTAITLDPDNAEAYRNRGTAHAMLRDFDESIKDLEKSIELDPGDFESHTTLANVHLRQEDFAPAIDSFGQAIATYEPEESTDPDVFVEGYLQRSDAALRLAKEKDTSEETKSQLYSQVIADSQAVLTEYPERFPESGRALHYQGIAFRMQGHLGEAIKAFTDAIQLAPAGETGSYIAEAYRKRGICWHYQEQGSLARGDFEQSSNINFEDPLPDLWIGYTYAQEEDYRQAIESYGEAIAKNPQFPIVYVNRGLAYLQLEEYKKAVENFNEAIRHESEDVARSRHFYKRGIAYLWLEDYQKAYDSFHLATLYDESYEAAFRREAEALRQLGRPGLADQIEGRANELLRSAN